MKLLLLDLDGVLNNGVFYKNFKGVSFSDPVEIIKAILDPLNLKNLKLVDDKVNNLKVVISSSWGKKYSVETFKQVFKSLGFSFEVIALTPKTEHSKKTEEVINFLEDYKGKNFKIAIVDDERIIPLTTEYRWIMSCFVKTDQRLGLTTDNALEIIDLLS